MRNHLIIAAASLLVLILGISAVSCSDDSCYDNGSSLPLASLCVGGREQSVTGLTVAGIGVPGTTLILDSATASQVYLPLRANASSSSFMMRRTTISGSSTISRTDTITVDYEPIEYFHSMECGAMFNFDVKRVTHTRHGIDSITVLYHLITNSRTPALRIHLAQ